VTGKILDRFNW